eukprot:TRINITY_DN968_c0_g1_i3.p1 TRINITY_DN968_c0_g1~~TRINITY_DN968_c0_g1_i3.p1  ORF type:complete len:381 (-),score=82.58 TRINITY_DN968_c0_g1_i3:59-1201(-)
MDSLETTTFSESIAPSSCPMSFRNCKGMLEMVGVYSDNVQELSSRYRKWALQNHPDKTASDNGFFSLVSSSVKVCDEYLRKYNEYILNAEKKGVEPLEKVQSFKDLRVGDKVRFLEATGTGIYYGIVTTVFPPASNGKLSISFIRTSPNWERDPAKESVYRVIADSVKEIYRTINITNNSPNSNNNNNSTVGSNGVNNNGTKSNISATDTPDFSATTTAGTTTTTTTTTTPTTPTPSHTTVPVPPLYHVFTKVPSVKALKPGDRFFAQNADPKVGYIYGIVKSVPTYDDIVEYLKTDAKWAPSYPERFCVLHASNNITSVSKVVSSDTTPTQQKTPKKHVPKVNVTAFTAPSPSNHCGASFVTPADTDDLNCKKRKIVTM